MSRQYIDVCNENGVKGTSEVKLGAKLKADKEYLEKARYVLFEIGVKLGHVLWRKIKPNDLESADKHLNHLCYNLLAKGDYELVLNLLKFATEVLKKHFDQESICLFQINKSLSYYLSGKKDQALKVLSLHDWSASNDKFRLAVAVLKEEYPLAVSLMKSIGANNEYLKKEYYREWPLFSEFRKNKSFIDTYEDIFNEKFVYTESKPHELEDIMNSMKIMKEKIKNSIEEQTK